MAFGGVETGIIKPSDDESAMPIATGIGLKPSERAVPIAIGAMRLVAAVCEVSSDRTSASTQKRPTNSHSDGLPPRLSLIPFPSQSESPVE